MEQFNIEVVRLEDLLDGTCSIEFCPTNLQLSDLIRHCDIEIITGTLSVMAEAELEEDRVEMYDIMCEYFPDIMVNYYL